MAAGCHVGGRLVSFNEAPSVKRGKSLCSDCDVVTYARFNEAPSVKRGK